MPPVILRRTNLFSEVLRPAPADNAGQIGLIKGAAVETNELSVADV